MFSFKTQKPMIGCSECFVSHWFRDRDLLLKKPLHYCEDCGNWYPVEDFLQRVMCRDCQVKIARHPQVLVTMKDGEQFHVDIKLKELICLLNHHGYKTINSCQENRPNIAWIQFAWDCVADFSELFYRIREIDSELFNKMNDYEWHVPLIDYDFEENGTIEMSLSLRFPTTDIEMFTAVMRKF